MTGLLALSPNFWSDFVIAISIFAAIAIDKKPCRWPFGKNRRDSSARPPVICK